MADERVEVVAQALKAIDNGWWNHSAEYVAQELIAALWPAPAEDEVEAVAPTWIKNPFRQIFKAELLLLGKYPITITTEAWPQSEGWKVWKADMEKLAASARQPKPAHDAEAALPQDIHEKHFRKWMSEPVPVQDGDATHDAEVADAAVQRCIEVVESIHAHNFTLQRVAERLRALLTSEPSNG